MKVFFENVQKINEHNLLNERTYDMGINQFTHLTSEEFAEQYLNSFEKNSNYVEVDI